MTVAALARGVPAAILLLLALPLTCARSASAIQSPPTEGNVVAQFDNSTWTALFEKSGTASQTFWSLSARKPSSTTLPSGLPEYYGATVYPVIPTWQVEDGDDSAIMVTLRASMALRDNMAAVFGYLLYLPENDLGEELYSALSLIHELVRLRRIPMAELVLAVPEMADLPPGKQFLVLFRQLTGVVPHYARGAVEVWIKALELNELDMDGVMRPNGGPLIVDFLSGFGQSAIKKLRLDSLKWEKDLDKTHEHKDRFISHVLNSLRSGSIHLSQPLFGLILYLRSRSTICPDKEETERHLVDSLMHNKVHGWNRVTWSLKNEDLESINNLITNIIFSLLSQGDLEPHTQVELLKVIDNNETPTDTFMNPYYNALASILSEPSLDIVKLFEIIIPGEYPEEIVDLRWRVEHYIRNDFIDVELSLRGFNRFDYATPQDLLVALLTRIQRFFNNLPHEILSAVSHLKSYINFKICRSKLLPIQNTDIIDMLNTFESYHVPDKVVAISLKLKAYLQIENIDWTEALQNVNAESCGQPRSCIRNLFNEALNINLLKGRKSKQLIEFFLKLLNEDGDPVHLWDTLSNDNHYEEGDHEMAYGHSDHLPTIQKQNKKINEEDEDDLDTIPGNKIQKHNGTKKHHKTHSEAKATTGVVADIVYGDVEKNTSTNGKVSKNRRRYQSSKSGSKISRNRRMDESKTVEKSRSFPLSSVGIANPNTSSLSSIFKDEILSSHVQPLSPSSVPFSTTSSSSRIRNSPQPSSISEQTRAREENKSSESQGKASLESASIADDMNPGELRTYPDENDQNEQDVAGEIDSVTRQKRNVEYQTHDVTTEITSTDNLTTNRTEINDTTIREPIVQQGGFDWDPAIASVIPTTLMPEIEENSSGTLYLELTTNPETSTEVSRHYRNNKHNARRMKSKPSPDRLQVKTRVWSKKRGVKHSHYEKSSHLSGSRPFKNVDIHKVVIDSKPIYYDSIPTLEGRRPIRYRLKKSKNYRKLRSKRKHYHSKIKHHHLRNAKKLNRRDFKDYSRSSTAEDNSMIDNDQQDYTYEEPYLFDYNENARAESSEESKSRCHRGNYSGEETYSDEDYQCEGSEEGSEPIKGSRSEEYFEAGSEDLSRESTRKNLDITSSTPMPQRHHQIPHIFPLLPPRHYGPHIVLTREWSRKRRKHHKHKKFGIRPVGFVSEDYHEPEHQVRGHIIEEKPFQPWRFPLLFGRKPIRSRLIKYKRYKIIHFKRLRRARKIPAVHHSNKPFYRLGYDFDDDNEDVRNETRRGYTFDPHSEEQYDHQQYDENRESSGEDGDEYAICGDGNEGSLECLKTYQDSPDSTYYYPRYVYSPRAEREEEMRMDSESRSDEGEHGNRMDDYDELYDYGTFPNDYEYAHIPSTRPLPFTNLKSGLLDELLHWKRRLQNGWKPPKFSIKCHKQRKRDLVCEDKSTATGIIYKGPMKIQWKGNWTYPSDLLEITSRLSNNLITKAWKLNLENNQGLKRGDAFMNLNDVTSVEVLLEILSLAYEQEAEQHSNYESPLLHDMITTAGTAVPSRPIIVGFPPPQKLLDVDLQRIRRLLAPASSARLPVPDESDEVEPANYARLDTLLPFTVPGTFSDVKMRPLRILLGLPEIYSLLDEGNTDEFAPAWGARKGPLLREVLTRAAQSSMVKNDPLLKKAMTDFMESWNARRKTRPRPMVDPASLLDALPLTVTNETHRKESDEDSSEVESKEAALAAVREFLTQPERRAAAVAALGDVTGVDVTKGQLLQGLLQRARDNILSTDKKLADYLKEVSHVVLQDGLGAQAPMRTLIYSQDGAAAISVDARVLFRDALNPERVISDNRATAALKELLRSSTARSFNAGSIFRGFDASPYLTRAQLLTAVLRHLKRAGPSSRVRSAARTLVPFVEEKGIPVNVEIDGLSGHRIEKMKQGTGKEMERKRSSEKRREPGKTNPGSRPTAKN